MYMCVKTTAIVLKVGEGLIYYLKFGGSLSVYVCGKTVSIVLRVGAGLCNLSNLEGLCVAKQLLLSLANLLPDEVVWSGVVDLSILPVENLYCYWLCVSEWVHVCG